jgi:pantothenate kinase-related protein Tda10
VYVPEWTLQDEVKSIAEVTARKWVVQHWEEKQDSPLPETGENGGSDEEVERALNAVSLSYTPFLSVH